MTAAKAPHSSTLAWKIPWMAEPGGLQSMGSRRVGHNWATSLSLFTSMHCRRKWQPTPVFLPGESQGQGSLVGCRLWGRRVGHDWSDLAEFRGGLPKWCSGKESTRQTRRPGFDPWVSKISWRRKCNPFQYSCLGNPMGRGTWWATYSPWGCKESDTTEWLNTNAHRVQSIGLGERDIWELSAHLSLSRQMRFLWRGEGYVVNSLPMAKHWKIPILVRPRRTK